VLFPKVLAMLGQKAVVVALVVGCNSSPDSDRAGGTAPSSSAPALASAARGTASASASAASIASASPAAGSWAGSYEAKKTVIALAKGVKDRAWAADDGSKQSGKGDVEVSVAPDGTVTGQVSGALGQGQLVGVVEEGRCTASLVPDDPAREGAMTGTLVADVKGTEIDGLIRAASADGVVVREAPVRLKRR
jgi:hypothetical protein